MKINKKKLIVFVILIALTIFIKITQYNILPAKYFYDPNKIFLIMNENYKITDKAFSFTASFFKKVDILGINTIQEWSIIISVIFSVILLAALNRKDKFNDLQSFFILLSVGVLNIYVFNLSKDLIQFIFFLMIYFTIISKKLNNTKKIIICNIILLYVGIYFKTYFYFYLIIADTIYFIYYKTIRNKVHDKKSIMKIMLIFLVVFFIEIFFIQMISTTNYNSIMNARYSSNIYREDSTDAVTIINDLLGRNTNFGIFIGNYIINLIRLLFPIELIFKGVKYFPFILYQMIVTLNVIKSVKKINDKNIVAVCIVVGFLMISAIFEPDFGSFVRHESVLFLILLEMSYYDIIEGKEVRNEKI